jgi:hypothetical protein
MQGVCHVFGMMIAIAKGVPELGLTNYLFCGFNTTPLITIIPPIFISPF